MYIFKVPVNYIEKMQPKSFCLPWFVVVSEQDEGNQLPEKIYLIVLGKKVLFFILLPAPVLCGPASTSVAMRVWWRRRGGLRSVPLVTAVLESKRQQPRFCVGVK